ncbi:MAG: hypothetical protein WDW38_010595 [Sanguina aurantia]
MSRHRAHRNARARCRARRATRAARARALARAPRGAQDDRSRRGKARRSTMIDRLRARRAARHRAARAARDRRCRTPRRMRMRARATRHAIARAAAARSRISRARTRPASTASRERRAIASALGGAIDRASARARGDARTRSAPHQPSRALIACVDARRRAAAARGRIDASRPARAPHARARRAARGTRARRLAPTARQRARTRLRAAQMRPARSGGASRAADARASARAIARSGALARDIAPRARRRTRGRRSRGARERATEEQGTATPDSSAEMCGINEAVLASFGGDTPTARLFVGNTRRKLLSLKEQVISLVDALSANATRLATSEAACLRLTAQLRSKQTMDPLGPPRAEDSSGGSGDSGSGSKAGSPATAAAGSAGAGAAGAGAGAAVAAGAGVDESAEAVEPPGIEAGPLAQGAAFEVPTAAAVEGARGWEARAEMALRASLRRTEELEGMMLEAKALHSRVTVAEGALQTLTCELWVLRPKAAEWELRALDAEGRADRAEMQNKLDASNNAESHARMALLETQHASAHAQLESATGLREALEEEYWRVKEALLMADLSAGELRAGREQAEGQLKATRAELAEVAHEVEENRSMRRQLEADLVGCKAWIRTMERTGREHVLLLREVAGSRELLSARELALRESEDRTSALSSQLQLRVIEAAAAAGRSESLLRELGEERSSHARALLLLTTAAEAEVEIVGGGQRMAGELVALERQRAEAAEARAQVQRRPVRPDPATAGRRRAARQLADVSAEKEQLKATLLQLRRLQLSALSSLTALSDRIDSLTALPPPTSSQQQPPRPTADTTASISTLSSRNTSTTHHMNDSIDSLAASLPTSAHQPQSSADATTTSNAPPTTFATHTSTSTSTDMNSSMTAPKPDSTLDRKASEAGGGGVGGSNGGGGSGVVCALLAAAEGAVAAVAEAVASAPGDEAGLAALQGVHEAVLGWWGALTAAVKKKAPDPHGHTVLRAKLAASESLAASLCRAHTNGQAAAAAARAATLARQDAERRSALLQSSGMLLQERVELAEGESIQMSLSLRELQAQHTSLLGRWTELTSTRETQAALRDSLQLQLAASGLAALSADDHAAQASASAAAAADTLKELRGEAVQRTGTLGEAAARAQSAEGAAAAAAARAGRAEARAAAAEALLARLRAEAVQGAEAGVRGAERALHDDQRVMEMEATMADALRHDEATSATLRHARHDTAQAEGKMRAMKAQLDAAAQQLAEQQQACWALQVEVQQEAGDTRRALRAWVDARFTPPTPGAAAAAEGVEDDAAGLFAPPVVPALDLDLDSEPEGLPGSILLT